MMGRIKIDIKKKKSGRAKKQGKKSKKKKIIFFPTLPLAARQRRNLKCQPTTHSSGLVPAGCAASASVCRGRTVYCSTQKRKIQDQRPVTRVNILPACTHRPPPRRNPSQIKLCKKTKTNSNEEGSFLPLLFFFFLSVRPCLFCLSL